MRRLPGFTIRLCAMSIDLLITLLVTYGISHLFLQGTIARVFISVLNITYYIILPIIWDGFTIGMYILGIKIQRIDSKNINLATMILRVPISCFFYGLTLGIALFYSLLMMTTRDDKRAIHDFISRTYVLYADTNRK